MVSDPFRFKGSRKDEVLGITPNRLIRIDLGVGEVVKTWRYNNMRQWNVNWDIRQVTRPVNQTIKMFTFFCTQSPLVICITKYTLNSVSLFPGHLALLVFCVCLFVCLFY